MQGAETEDGHGETLGPQHACEERARLERLGWYVYEAAREDVPRAPDPRPQEPEPRPPWSQPDTCLQVQVFTRKLLNAPTSQPQRAGPVSAETAWPFRGVGAGWEGKSWRSCLVLQSKKERK